MKKATFRALGIICAVSVGAGCNTTAAKRKQLERVAKDWCMTIRASQVIPVYPLTEDLRPGDVFLVNTPIEKEPDIYESKGFLPLEQMLVRIKPDKYSDFYESNDINDNSLTPFLRRKANQQNTATNLPRAAFPSYNFSISRGGGSKLALPISGVPVAFNILQARSAKGSVTISDASTYGIDVLPIYNQLKKWVSENAEQLAAYLPVRDNAQGSKTNYTYLRVVNRVYLTRGVSVSLSDTSTFGAAGSAGADKPITLPTTSDNAHENYTNMLNALNASVADAATPGGSFKFTSATSRGVSLSETFTRPLVVGYLGFDVPIVTGTTREYGVPAATIGAPIDTQSRLDNRTSKPLSRVKDMATRLNNDRADAAERIAAHVDNGSGKVDTEKLRGLLANTGVPSSFADNYSGQTTAQLQKDLTERYSSNVQAIARNLP